LAAPTTNESKTRKNKSTLLIISAIFFNQYQPTAAQMDLNYTNISNENSVKIIKLSIKSSDECHEWYLNSYVSAHFINNKRYFKNYRSINNHITVRKLPDIHREFPRHVARASYPGGMIRVPPWKHYIGSPLLPSELDIWKLGAGIIRTLAKLFRFGNYISEKRRFSERKILNSFLFENCEKVAFSLRYHNIFN
jgi:hypothetical protein